MIIGGSHKEWPEEYEREAYYMEVTMEGYEDWLWEQVLEDGPPQSDDIKWLKFRAWRIGHKDGAGLYSDEEADFFLDNL